jgi:4-hydroxy-tetrahydrodipicolinate synthase
VVPQTMQAMCTAAMAGDLKKATELHMQMLPLHQALFAEPNPIPVKWALARMGKAGGTLRLPLTPLSAASSKQLEAVMQKCGML